ncbi:MAG TPA: response regulator [Candidatus Acidoferrum sp.]|nr:response regulator [Candidatus Acidoferrum sp.]
MAKILVADDNSNIQKMVGLALKDQGIDVVAVGNGEAAVRKISDVRPDLVLADVFMPVRNGYEVCNYVKQDSALSHIPVILLVGAFDPLDEQEAQRVGADGVLKKPFVPPDPLISMVKSALTRAGVVIGAAEPAAAPPPPPPAAASRPEPPPLPKLAPPPPPAQEAERDLDVPLFSPSPTPVAIDKADQPLAFQTLLDAPAEEEPAYTTSDGSAAPERDWGHNADEQEEEHQEEGTGNGAWRSSSIEEFPNEAPAGQTDWREAAFAGIDAGKSFKEWAPSVEKNSLSITEDEAAELAKAQQAQASETADGGPEDWSKAINAIFDKPAPASEAATTKTEASPEPAGQDLPAPPAPEPVLSSPAAEEAVEALTVEPSPALNSWMAGALSPWEAELQRANELSSTWDSLKAEPAVAVDETSPTEAFLNSGLMATAHEHVVEAIEETQAEPDLAARPAEEAPATPESPYSAENEAGELLPSFGSAPETAPPAAAPSSTAPAEPNMDELVARVLEKMNPEVLQAVTREILKPVVEALVRDELSKKP